MRHPFATPVLARPKQVNHINGKTTVYVYGPDGSRLQRITGGKYVTYLDDIEIDQNGVFTKYPHDNIKLVGQANSGRYVLLRDHLSSVAQITDQVGASVSEVFFRPGGQPANPTEISDDKLFLGERYDRDTELYYLNARYYDPNIGLFILVSLLKKFLTLM